MLWSPMPAGRITALATGLACAALVAGCGSGSGGVRAPKIGAARTFRLAGFQPSRPVRPGVPTRVSFHIQMPSGQPLTKFKTGAGPHTGVHLIMVRKDLSTIIHRHPPIAKDGTISMPVTFTKPGPYRVLVDVYPDIPDTQPNFQLFGNLRVRGAYHPKPFGAYRGTAHVGGATVAIGHKPHLKALTPAFLDVTVRDRRGGLAHFTPWYGALAHAVFFRKGSLDYFHTHVCAPSAPNCGSTLGGAKVAGTATASKPGKLHVGILLPVGGTWRLFLQTKVHGRVITAPFTLKAAG